MFLPGRLLIACESKALHHSEEIKCVLDRELVPLLLNAINTFFFRYWIRYITMSNPTSESLKKVPRSSSGSMTAEMIFISRMNDLPFPGFRRLFQLDGLLFRLREV